MAKNANPKTWNLPVRWNGNRYSEASDVPANPSWQLDAGHYETAKIPLEIIAPRAGLTTENRHYKQYPGIEYRVPVVVLGGAWPFLYELTTAPPGMVIGQTYGEGNYGIIVWSSPTAGSHSVAVRVTDQEGTIATVSYTLTVTTSGFLFMDAVSGNDSNDGLSPAAPKKTIAGWYGGATTTGRDASTFQGSFVYLRAGTYDVIGTYSDPALLACVLRSDRKPVVWMGYPGETATLDLEASAMSLTIETPNNVWFSNITVKPRSTAVGGGAGFCGFNSGGSDIGFFENIYNPPLGSGATNASTIFSRNATNDTQYLFIKGCTWSGTNKTDLFLGYKTNKCVFESNTVTNNDWNGFYAKTNNDNWSVRQNVGLTGNSNVLFIMDLYENSDALEVCWNNYKTTGRGVIVGPNAVGTMGTLSDYRNTWQVAYNIASYVPSGTWNATRNVVIHDGTRTDGYGLNNGSGVTINKTQLLTATSGVVNSSTGQLTGSDRTTYLGIRGHEVA